jgi:hypothetical protein
LFSPKRNLKTSSSLSDVNAVVMNYLRELLYRPRRSDKSLVARFYFADLNLNAVAAELDSFDGRKDPDRCSCLVNKLRSCQDKLLGICGKMLEEIEPGVAFRSREFRAKFPGKEPYLLVNILDRRTVIIGWPAWRLIYQFAKKMSLKMPRALSCYSTATDLVILKNLLLICE